MLTFCNFGEHQLVEAHDLGIDGIRCDVPVEGDLVPFVRQFAGSPVMAAFLLHDPGRISDLLAAIRTVQIPDEQTAIEVFNEPPDKDDVDREDYIGGVLDVWEECQHRNYGGTVIAGAQKNLSAESMRWYRDTVRHLPDTITVACHDYPWGLQVTDLPWPPPLELWNPGDGPMTHQRAIDNLRTITGARPLVCSEVGRHMAPELTGHPAVQVTLTEDWIYWWLIDRLRFYAANNFVWTAVYQWSDDARYPGTSEGMYGIHTAPPAGQSLGQRKRQAYALSDWTRLRSRTWAA